jgi:flagellar hook assembly protein FlgD
VTIFDLSGRVVKQVFSDAVDAGGWHITWDGTDESRSNLGSGVYLVRVEAHDEIMNIKVIKQ